MAFAYVGMVAFLLPQMPKLGRVNKKTFEVTIHALLVLSWVREKHIYKCMCIDAYCVQDIET